MTPHEIALKKKLEEMSDDTLSDLLDAVVCEGERRLKSEYQEPARDEVWTHVKPVTRSDGPMGSDERTIETVTRRDLGAVRVSREEDTRPIDGLFADAHMQTTRTLITTTLPRDWPYEDPTWLRA